MDVNIKLKKPLTLLIIGSLVLLQLISQHSLHAKSTQLITDNNSNTPTRQAQSPAIDVKRESKPVEKRFLLSDPSSPQKQNAERRQDDDNKKSMSHVSSSLVGRSESAGSMEQWSPHNLMPTFVDQEQGDEMVALASEIAAENVRPATGGNKSDRIDSRKKELDTQQQRQAEKQRHQTSEEYYGDDDEDEDEVPSGDAKRPASDYEPHTRAAAKPKDQRKANQPGPMEQDDIGIPMAGFELSSNKSIVANGQKSYIPMETYPSSSASIMQQPKQQKQKLSQHGQKVTPTSRIPTVDKLASMLSPHDVKGTFSRTDMAIEYLRNILKSKQQQRQNLTIQEPPQSADSMSNNSSRILVEEHQLRPYNSKYSSNKQQSSDSGKFSISDAKPIAQQPTLDGSSFFGSAVSPIDMISTTRLPQDSDLSQALQDKHPYQLNDQLTGLPNGSPFGDYTELADDSARGYEQPQMSSSMLGPRYTPLENNEGYSQQPFSRDSMSADAMHQRPTPTRHEHSDLEHSQSAQAMIEQQVAKSSKSVAEPTYQNQQFSGQQSSSSKTAPRQQDDRRPIQSLIQTAELLQAEQPTISNTGRKYSQLNSTVEQVPEVESLLRDQRQQAETRPNTPPSGLKQPQQELRATKSSQAVQQSSRPKQAEYEQQVPQVASKQSEQQPANLSPASSKLYREDSRSQVFEQHQLQQQQQQHDPRLAQVNHYGAQQKQPTQSHGLPRTSQSQQQPQSGPQQKHQQQHYHRHRDQPSNLPTVHTKPPKLVGYNFYEGPSDGNGERVELIPTNFQLGDALYGSHGGVEQVLSAAELEAIQSQFLTAEHPIVPIQQSRVEPIESHPHDTHSKQHHNQQQQQQDAQLSGSLASLKPEGIPPDVLQRLVSHEKQVEESLKELASSEEGQVSAVSPPRPLATVQQPVLSHQGTSPAKSHQQPARPLSLASSQYLRDSRAPITAVPRELRSESPRPGQSKQEEVNVAKKKSLIVYLNHPRSTDMPRGQMPGDDSIAQSVFDQYSQPFVTAKEFDSQGLSKDGKHLDIANLSNSDSKDGLNPDKDGLSVVVIGDAYKYKKIVLLISSKTGGLKFIPMVKDMKK